MVGLMLFLGFAERRGEPSALRVGFGEARFDLAELGARGGEIVLALGEAAGEAGGFVERLIDGCLQRAFFVVEQRQLLARAGKLAVELDVALLGDVVLLFEDAAAFGQRTALRAFLRQLAFDLDDLRVARVDFVGQFKARALQAAVRLARQFEILAQLLHLALQRDRLLLDLIEFRAQRVVGGTRLGQHVRQAGRLRLFLFQRAQGIVERGDDLFEGVLQIVQFADLAAGVGEQIAQRLVLLAHARADVGHAFDADVFAVAVAVACAGQWPGGVCLSRLAAENLGKLSHYKASTP